MKQDLNIVPRLFLLALLAALTSCSTVKDLTNVDLGSIKVWPFGNTDVPRVYQPANSVPYMCEGNKKFFVRMLENGASAWLILPEREVLLTQSGASKVYTNGISKLDLSSEAVTLDVNATTQYVACKANGVAKVTKVESAPAAAPIVLPVPVVVTAPAIKQVPAPVVVPQVVEARPAETPGAAIESVKEAPVAEVKVTDQEAVLKTLEAWASAWRSKNTDAYLSFYSANFKPEGMSQKAWIAQRKQRLGSNPAEITLVLESVKVGADANKAEVSFVQRYTSGKVSDTVVKVLRFENENGHWFIVKETAQAKK
jgi:hypothetical protein